MAQDDLFKADTTLDKTKDTGQTDWIQAVGNLVGNLAPTVGRTLDEWLVSPSEKAQIEYARQQQAEQAETKRTLIIGGSIVAVGALLAWMYMKGK